MTQTDLFSDHLNDASNYYNGRSKLSLTRIVVVTTPRSVKIFKDGSVGTSSAAKEIRFDGSDVAPDLDNVRLTGQLMRIYELMKSGSWFSLGEIAKITEDPESSVSAQLRNFRKERFGRQIINKRRRGEEKTGLWEYQLIINKPIRIEDENDVS